MYSVHQWFLLFYIYCFLGWIWESCYVSFGEHKLVNRGFLKGPFLPIYGSGAILVLISTIPIQKNIILIFIVGMIAATILEYLTGTIMEKLFHVRYWDYSEKLFNINGHICLKSSLAWGVFSVFLVRFANPPIETLIILIPNEISEISAYVITIFITIDFVKAFNEAMDLKDILIRITERNEFIVHVKKRIEVAETFSNGSFRGTQQKSKEVSSIIDNKNLSKKQIRKNFIEDIIIKKLDLKEQKIKELSEKILTYIDKFDKLSSKSIDEPEKLKSEFLEYLSKIKAHQWHIDNTKNKIYINSIKLLRRNPNAKSKKYEEAMSEVKDLDKDIK